MVHSFDIVHRDIKSANVMLATWSLEDPLAKLGDFGASRESHDDAPFSPRMVGTPGFAPPEQYRRSHDCAVDVYAFGMLGYEICTMKSPIAAAASVLKELWRARGNSGPVEEQFMLGQGIKKLYQRGWRPDVGGIQSAMAQVLTACWADNPAERTSMDGIVTELRRLNSVQLPAGNADVQVPDLPSSGHPLWWSEELPPELGPTPAPVPGVFRNQARPLLEPNPVPVPGVFRNQAPPLLEPAPKRVPGVFRNQAPPLLEPTPVPVPGVFKNQAT